MAKAYDIIEGIGAAYNYVLKHIPFEPNDDLYQDIACDYINLRNNGKPHGYCLTYIRNVYTKKYNNQMPGNSISIDDCVILCMDNADINAMRHALKDSLDEAISTLTEQEQLILYKRFFENKTLDETAREVNRSRIRVYQIESRAIRELRKPSRAKKFKDFLY